MLNDRFAQLLALRFAGEATDEDLRELQVHMDSHPDASAFYRIFAEYWNNQAATEHNDIQDEIHFQQIIAIAEKGNPSGVEEESIVSAAKAFPLRRFLAAALFLGVFVCGYFLLKKPESVNAEPALNEVVAKAGTRSRLLLPDGSTVWLNAVSKLEYRGSFNGALREVYLEGEAYFDVQKDKSRPFIVHTSDLDIRVLGTAFNVKSYPKDDVIEATLIHGLIEVTNKNEPTSPKVILQPHDKLVFNKARATQPAKNQPVNAVAHKPFSITALPKALSDTAIAETSWIYNRLVFDGETFREIAASMERWYDVKIEFRNEALAAIPIHVSFKDETLREALQALQLIADFKYTINGNKIQLSKR